MSIPSSSTENRMDSMKLCECGCGQPAPIATMTRKDRGVVKGQVMRFVVGHHMRVPQIRSKVFTPERSSKISRAKRGVPLPQNSRPGELNPMWRGDEVGYSGAHQRLKETRGTANQYACVVCGNPAAEWAVNHAAPSLEVGHHGGMDKPYSADPQDYRALCRSCHRSADLNGGFRD